MCEVCRQYPCHPKCPNYKNKNEKYICSFCNGDITDGEEYITNQDNEVIHYDCIFSVSTRWLLEWLGCEVKEMEENYD